MPDKTEECWVWPRKPEPNVRVHCHGVAAKFPLATGSVIASNSITKVTDDLQGVLW